jgi:hypothetical protein
MIKHLQHSEIDKVKWDSAIDQSTNGVIYAKSWYLDIVSPNWQALVDEDYKSVFPLTCRQKYGFKYLYPPFFTQQLGVFSKEIIGGEAVNQMLNAIPGGFRFIEINLNHQNSLSSNDFKATTLLTHHLNLNRPYGQISKGYSENLKRNLKKASQNNLQVISGFNNKSLIELFRSTKGQDIHTLKDSDYETFKKLLFECEKRNLLIKLGIEINNELVAGAIFLRSNHEYILIFSAVNNTARETGAMSFLIDQFIQSHENENMNLDFEGSMDKNLARFYKSFGASEVVYLQIKRNRLPFYLRWLKKQFY